MRRRRWPVLLLLASGLTFLTSLYLPWQQGHLPDTLGAGQHSPLHVFGEDAQSIDGWGEFGVDFGFAAAVFALALVVASVGALAGRRVPLVRCACSLFS